MRIEVIYALANEQKSFFVESSDPITVKEAIDLSKISETYENLRNLDLLKVGVYGKRVSLEYILNDKDRVEIYRELTIDPKQARMLRAEQKRKREGIKLFGA